MDLLLGEGGRGGDYWKRSSRSLEIFSHLLLWMLFFMLLESKQVRYVVWGIVVGIFFTIFRLKEFVIGIGQEFKILSFVFAESWN